MHTLLVAPLGSKIEIGILRFVVRKFTKCFFYMHIQYKTKLNERQTITEPCEFYVNFLGFYDRTIGSELRGIDIYFICLGVRVWNTCKIRVYL